MESMISISALEIQEANVSNLLSRALVEFMKLARDHAGRVQFENGINQLQYQVLAGPGIRQINEMNAIAASSVQPQEPSPEASADSGQFEQVNGSETIEGDHQKMPLPDAPKPRTTRRTKKS